MEINISKIKNLFSNKKLFLVFWKEQIIFIPTKKICPSFTSIRIKEINHFYHNKKML